LTPIYRDHIVEHAIDEVRGHLRDGALRVHVNAGAASGRSAVGSDLAAADLLDVLGPRHPDMVGDALLQVMSLTSASDQPEGALSERLAWMQHQLSARKEPVFVRLHNEWATTHREPDASGFQEHAETWLGALLGPSTRVPVVLIGAIAKGIDAARVRLNTPWIVWNALEDRVRWRDSNYEAAAFSVCKRCSGYERVSPIVFRLAVGRMALGDDIDRLEQDLARSGLQPRPHVEALVSLASAPQQPPALIDALSRVSRIRRPLPFTAAVRALGLTADDAHLDLFTACVGYEQSDGSVRWSEPVVDALRDSLRPVVPGPPDAVARQHHALADACRTVDWVNQPAQTQGLAGLRIWAEKVHHLARSGAHGAAEWARQDVRQSEQLWERARSLSWLGHYDEAAALYRRCIASDSEDAYAWHYLGFNLDKCGQDRVGAQEAYHEAVRLQPANPWWNARWVTWLIGQVRYAEAERAWDQSLGHIDPSGTRDDPWLVRHFYRHVVSAWLDTGEIRRARAAMNSIPNSLRSSGDVRDLEARLVDYEEAFDLQGACVRSGSSARPDGSGARCPTRLKTGPSCRAGTPAACSGAATMAW